MRPPGGPQAARGAPEGVAYLLTRQEAASVLRIHERTLRRLVAAGRIRVVHPTPGRTCITRRELDAYLASIEGRREA